MQGSSEGITVFISPKNLNCFSLEGLKIPPQSYIPYRGTHLCWLRVLEVCGLDMQQRVQMKKFPAIETTQSRELGR